MRIETALACALLAGSLATPALAGDCRLTRYTELPLSFDAAGGATIPMSIAGQNVTMLVDTGGAYSMLAESTVARLGLGPQRETSSSVTLVDGKKRLDHYVKGRDIRMGRMQGGEADFLVMPDGRMPAGVGGTLAPDIMRRFDIDLDFANARMNVLSKDHCGEDPVYWTSDTYAKVKIGVNAWGQMKVTARLDGKPVDTLITTGSPRSYMQWRAAKSALGIDENTPGLKTVDYPGGAYKVYRFPFKALTMDGVTVENPDIVMYDGTSDDTRLILGMGVLRQLHLYIAYDERMLYVTPASAH